MTTPDKNRATNRKILKWIGIGIAGFFAIGIIGSAFGSSEDKTAPDTTAISTPEATVAATKAAPVEPKGPQLTSQQRHAVASAEQYLSLQGFSRLALIEQLSSSSGDGYSRRDATVAVDSLRVDWNAQAVRSAKAYLELQSFSCRGLIEQLSSSAGDKYTRAQAQYGARRTDAC